MKFCQQCGSPLEEGSKFCTKCGFKIPDQPAGPVRQPVQPQPAQPVQPQPAQPVQPAFNVPAPKKKKGKALIIAIIACVLVVGIVAGVLILSRGKKNEAGVQKYEPEFIVHYREDTSELYAINKNGKVAKLENIDTGGYYYSSGKYEYDTDLYGKKAVFSVRADGAYTLYYYDGEFKKITGDYDYSGSSYGYGYLISEDGSTVVYVRDGEIWSYKDGKNSKLVSDVYQLTALSPDGKTVGYMKYDDDYSAAGYYVTGGKEHKLGKGVTPVVISNGAELVTTSKDSDGSVYVQNGDDSSTRVKLRNLESSSGIVVNLNCTAVIYGSDSGTYMWKKGMESPEKISSKNLGLADPTKVSGRELTKYGNIIRYMDTDFDGSVWYDKAYGSSGYVRLYTYNKGETEFLASVNSSSGYIGAEKIYYVEDGSVKYVSKLNPDADPVTVLKIGAQYVGEVGENLLCVITDDGDVIMVKDGKQQRICDSNEIYNAYFLDGKFFYTRDVDGKLYVTDGGKPQKVNGISGEVKKMEVYTLLRNAPGKVGTVVTDEATYYTTDGGNSFKQLYKN